MSYMQFSMLNKQVNMVQASHQKMMATNILLTQIQINFLLLNEEAEIGLAANSEDSDESVEESDGCLTLSVIISKC